MSAPEPRTPDRAEEAARAPLSKQRLRLWLRMLEATRHIEARLRDELRTEHDSTLPRFDVLAALYRRPAGLRMSELSAMLKVSNGNVTGIVERLAGEGHVERLRVEGDRRAMRVRLTEDGRARFAEMAGWHEARVNELLKDITAEELDPAIELLARIGRDQHDADGRD
ncbi:MarR family transcriptional regulator [Rhodosalinus halophilus]|uniref:MarR family transcriptional regulator n=1 Tax=Rhodosalinus halophilus TaxID=2259333 RepID=A0A365U7W3_9RHOB|nr:MarR family transcriptional regulator [Rhodosalinus halophilus]RBI84918.1 MarR family transcriptional regulator [Rhodosalinus halophilus]